MEKIDLYDNRKELMGKVFDRDSGEPESGEYKLSTHVWIINSKKEFLIQRRSATRKKNPLKWAFTGGAVDLGEKSYEGAIREVKEELGILALKENVELLLSFKREKDFVDVWLVRQNVDIKSVVIQEDEVCEAKFVDFDKLEHMVMNGEFVPAVDLYFSTFKKLLIKDNII